MPTAAEVRQQLTGPGGMFEITTKEVDGRTLQVFKNRLPSLRQIPELAVMRGDGETFIVYGDRTYGFQTFVETANGVAHALEGPLRPAPRRPRGRPVAEQPRVVPGVLGRPSTNGAVLVGLNGWWKTDEVEYGLQDSGAKVLVADRKRFERIAGSLDEAPDLEHVFLIDASPEDFPEAAKTGKLHRFDELTAEPDRHLRRHADRRGGRGGHLLHVGHDRPAQGGGVDPPQHGRQPPEHDVRRGRRAPCAAPTCSAVPARRRRRADGVAVHVAAVPRVGLPLHARRRACSPASSW